MNNLKPKLAVLLFCFGGPLAACQNDEQASADPESQAGQGQTEQAPATSGILDQPMDGSSVEAFEADMEAVRSQSGQKAYERLSSAIDYLLAYDLGAQRDRAKLYQRLDGKTPKEIVAQAKR